MGKKQLQYWKDFFKSKIKERLRFPEKMDQVFLKVKLYDFPLHFNDALEVFGMHGLWHTSTYAKKFEKVDLWEIDSVYAEYAKRVGPNVNVYCGDSLKAIIENDKKLRSYDFIVVDNPMGMFGDKYYCEHFEIFPYIFKYLKNMPCLLVVNYIADPNFYKSTSLYNEYISRRSAFYKTNNIHITPDIVIPIYSDFASQEGFRVVNSAIIPRNPIVNYLMLMVEPV